MNEGIQTSKWSESSGDAPEPEGHSGRRCGHETRIEKISRIPPGDANITNSATAGELTGAEIRTLAKTAIELFGASVSKFANKFTSNSIDSSLFMTAKRDDGLFWDLRTREDKEKLEQLQQ